ncbi:hypothetical protein Afil01_28700 [Actinorhabdospora filicis]|uniref:Uncharacterized protein n=1 Tax=Actinorhabdospora filicis TaxID=1785913 RepID=A0A9W6SKS7_9ACTN|nr:hypothetical protein [Actinorhabdospora filicis]GLZ78063.1 hypothetical protein Afil01_28700 [Actinorhabdospora filicis]
MLASYAFTLYAKQRYNGYNAAGKATLNNMIKAIQLNPAIGDLLKASDTRTCRLGPARVDYKLIGRHHDQHIMITDVAA